MAGNDKCTKKRRTKDLIARGRRQLARKRELPKIRERQAAKLLRHQLGRFCRLFNKMRELHMTNVPAVLADIQGKTNGRKLRNMQHRINRCIAARRVEQEKAKQQ